MAIVKMIKNANRFLNEPPNWDGEMNGICSVLPIRDAVTEDGLPWMISAWELDPKEIQKLREGETLKLWIQGNQNHPVVAITVGEIE